MYSSRPFRFNYKRIRRFMAYGLFLNLTALVGLAWFSETKPVRDIQLTARRDGVLIFGQNRMGLLCVKIFPTWKSAIEFIDENNLELPIIRHAYKSTGQIVEILPNTDRQSFRILWRAGESKGVINAPDNDSAQVLFQFVRYSELQPSPFGFSFALNERR